ncbi:MAG: SURF1 family protein [Paracoccaceae bacterium]
MAKAMIGPLVFGVLGVALLLWLGSWQVQRLGWKQNVLAEIATQIAADPVSLPILPDASADRFLAVFAEGRFDSAEVHVLASNKDTGAGYRVIGVLLSDGRRIMVDRGFVGLTAKDDLRGGGQLQVVGNLHWPDEVDKYTPKTDGAANIWFARDVPAMALALNAEPVLIVASQATGDGVVPFPVNTASIPNNHLNYAITWFLLAAVWFGMTVYLLWRIKRQTNQ